LDNIAPTERKVYLALAEIWDPTTAKQVASVARLDVNKTSAILGRLEQEGRVARERHSGRKKLYKIAERMYNIYYLMRRQNHPSNRIKPFVQFIVHFYGPEEQVAILKTMAGEACNGDSQLRDNICLAFGEIFKNLGDFNLKSQLLESIPESFLNLPESITNLSGLIKDEITQELNNILAVLFKAVADNDIDTIKQVKRRYLAIYDYFIDRDIKWSILGFINYKVNENEEAIICLKKAIEYSPNDMHDLRLLATCYERTDNWLNAKTIYSRLIQIDPDNAVYNFNRGTCNFYLGEYHEAENDFDNAINKNLKNKIDAFWGLALIKLINKDDKGAIKNLEKALSNYDCTDTDCSIIINLLFTRFAALGYSKELSEILERSPAKEYLQPLAVALMMYLGEPVIVADEILEVAKDVVKKIEEEAKRIAEKK
jgi:tetratricopeptide (TPR) repeat protein